MGRFRLYLRLISISIQGQCQFPASLVMLAFGHFLITGIEFLGLYALFDRFSTVAGWNVAEVALFYGVVHMAFALAEALGRGFDFFDRMVRSGEFDIVLLRPRSEILLVSGQELRLNRVGRFLQGLLVLVWGLHRLGLETSTVVWVRLIWGMAGGTALFCGLFVLQATLAFWTVNTLEIVNTVTYGGVETAQFPIDIYRPWFRAVFTWVIPLACINYFPLHDLLRGGGQPLAGWAAPAVGFVFLLVSLRIWRLGVSHYTSTGS